MSSKVYEDAYVTVWEGDNISLLETFYGSTVDAIVTDPPYGIKFMGMKWDYSTPSVDLWRESLRLLKPGGFLLAFTGARTYHRTVCNIEDAGFEIRDMIIWAYGSGFPKAVKTHLKPAIEPLVLARKPFKGSAIANYEKHKTGFLGVDACRIPSGAHYEAKCKSVVGLDSDRMGNCYGDWAAPRTDSSGKGRFPANLIHDGSEEVLGIFGYSKDGLSPARIFYCPKASKRERGEGNTHSTVKPLTLMRYLIKLITPMRGVVLDPFAGSGTTGIAARLENREAVLLEKDPAYCAIAVNRIKKGEDE